MKSESDESIEQRPKPKARQHILVLSAASIVIFLVTLIPNGQWPATWGNFFGALLVAVSGLLITLQALEVAKKKIGAWSYAFIVTGGFAIAGASLQVILWPPA